MKLLSFVLDYILYYHYQRILCDCLRYVGFEAFFKTLAGSLHKISIKRAWVTSILNIMSSRMSLYSRNKTYSASEVFFIFSFNEWQRFIICIPYFRTMFQMQRCILCYIQGLTYPHFDAINNILCVCFRQCLHNGLRDK